MLKSKPVPPRVPGPKPRRDPSVGRDERHELPDPNHWSCRIQETLVSALPEESLHITLQGGADNRLFCYLDDIKHENITYHSGRLQVDCIVLEIQGQKISGYTQRDANTWLKQVSQNGAPVMFKTVRSGLLPKDLGQYLTARFQKGSVDHDLQQTIRDNLYLRTVPCTTRSPRPGEVNGVDYTFLSMKEFEELEKNGSLLESGIFDGNHYGTPKPPKDPQGAIVRRTSSIGNVLPGAHPSSEGKRRRNRSNTEATPKSPGPSKKFDPPSVPRQKPLERSQSSGSLGPLPGNWEMAFTDEGHPYFIDHDTEQTSWLDPRLAKMQKDNTGLENELPYGWEKVEDPHYGTYYIDHVNRKTQYEHPSGNVKKSSTADDINGTSTLPKRGKNGDIAKRSVSESDMNGRNTPPDYRPRHRKNKTPLTKRAGNSRVFTKNPAELRGDIFSTTLVKGERGLGFTIIGGDHLDEEFLQIKNVVQNGPAYNDGKLQTGDVLVYVNDHCVLGYTHQDVVNLFQTILPGDSVTLQVCRGYALPFDPDDPNTEIITTMAVSLPQNDTHSSNSPASYSSRENPNTERHNTSTKSLKSLPDLAKSADMQQSSGYLPNSGQDSGNNAPDVLSPSQSKPEYHTIYIVRGDMGFGFTIADSPYGQRVKQILDKARCKTLQEGDVLQEINNEHVNDMTHSQIVQVLKDCPKGTETKIVIQRGGVPLKIKKIGGKTTADQNGNHSSPGAYFFGDKAEDQSLNANGDGYMNMSRQVRDELDGNNAPEVPRRPKTPSTGEQRPKTPTRLGLMVSNQPKPNPVQNAPGSAHLSRKDYDSRDFDPHSHGQEPSHGDYSGRPPPGPRFDPFRSEVGPRTDFKGRPNFSMSLHNSYDRDSRFDRGNEMARPGQFRSRTPGPEMMQRSQGPDYRPENHRPKTPTAQDMRSKTPIPGLNAYGPIPGGNPDYSSSSRFQNSWNSNGPFRQGYENSRQWGSTIHEHPISPNMSRRMDNSDSYNRSYGSNFPTSGRVPRQSTSFETENPTPSNITRVPKRPPFHNSSFSNQIPGGQSPFLYPGTGEDSINYIEINVVLERKESGFGFRIIGGTEEGSQVAVGHIVPGGAADLDGTLRSGDEILSCDGVSVINASHHKLVQLMGHAGFRGKVSLGIRRRIGVPASEGYPYDVVVSRREDEGFGFVIISSVSKAGSTIGEFIEKSTTNRSTSDDILNKKNLYPWIGRILDNSPAERCGMLHVGDRILAVNGVDISHLHHEDIVNIIKESGYSVTLTVGPPQDDSSSTASTSQRSSQGSMVNAMAYPAVNDVDGRRLDSSSGYRYPPPPPPPKDINRQRSLSNQQEIKEDQIYRVELNRGSRGFGFSIRGGQEFNNMPLFVLRIAEGGAADVDGRLRVGDQLLEINGYTTDSMTHSEAIDIIQNGGPTAQLLVRRTGKPPPSFEPTPSPGSRYPPTGPMSNGPIGQSSPYLGRRNVQREDNFYSSYHTNSRTYPNY